MLFLTGGSFALFSSSKLERIVVGVLFFLFLSLLHSTCIDTLSPTSMYSVKSFIEKDFLNLAKIRVVSKVDNININSF